MFHYPIARFHLLTLRYLSSAIICSRNNRAQPLWTEGIISSLYFGNKLNEWQPERILRFWSTKCITRGKNSQCYELLILVSGNYIKRAMCMLIWCKNCGIQLLWYQSRKWGHLKQVSNQSFLNISMLLFK